MSSTNINIGMLEGRNSSRVLKPPGGGHSQIFGFEDATPKQKNKFQISSEIKDCFSHAADNNHTKTEKDEVEENGKKPENEENGENVPDVVNGEDKKESTESTPPRKRVPPGGYSSGFW